MSRPRDTEYERKGKNNHRANKVRAEERLVVKPGSKPPAPPDFLEGEARDAWLRMARDLHDARILVKVSRDKLVRYCVAWAQWSNAVQQMNGIVYPRKWGDDFEFITKLDVWRKTMDSCERVMQDFEKHYGLTPLAATKIRAPSNVGGVSPEEELENFLEDEDENKES